LEELGLEHCPNITGSVFKEITLPRIKVVSLAYSKVGFSYLKNVKEKEDF